MTSHAAFPFRAAIAAAGLCLMACAALAGPTVDAWDLQTTDAQERLRIRWTEPASVEMHEFPAARQVVVKIPGATLGNDRLPMLDTASSRVLSGVRAQQVTLADGSDAVQLTLNMSEFAQPELVSSARFLSVMLPVSAGNAPASATTSGPRLLLSNADFEEDEARYGSSTSPATGAGQATGGTQSTAAFFIPPDLTSEQRQAQSAGADPGMLTTMNLFDTYVDLDFKNADLQNIIRSIARRLNLNIIMTPGQVQGEVTVSLTNVRLGDALDALLRSNDLAYKVEQGGIVRIVPRSQVRVSARELDTRAISINWVDAGDISAVIRPFLSGDGEVQFARDSNVLIIKDVPEALAEIQSLVARLDVPEKQVRMEVRMIDMTETAERQLGIQTNFTSSSTVTMETLDEAGQFDPTDPTLVAQPRGFGNVGLLDGGSGYFDVNTRQGVRIFGSRYDLDMRIRAQEERGEAVTLAAPTVLSLNNVPASIEIKRQIPYRDAVNSTQGSVATIRFADIGTKVELRPRITNNGFVTMNITPEQKILVDVDSLTGVPVIDERFALTSVTVKDESTVALGGLRQFESLASETGVPWIMRTPVLGWFFKNQSNQQSRLELYLFVTPTIIKDPEPTPYEYGLYEKIDYNWDLPDFYFDEVRPRSSPRELDSPYVRR